ncbi:hypothetical protein [Ensifer sp. 1H6]|uniref:hypothetical protein n=1 Tax=Ensifer sp. 1H6 TaxID=1911585 RepID=UPI0009D3E0C2|nr:hypothetical protein [Ensifer sp. 1H6]OMQ43747.1 hypothetical protein BKP54_17190 [Ensifer sp. 1H6]
MFDSADGEPCQYLSLEFVDAVGHIKGALAGRHCRFGADHITRRAKGGLPGDAMGRLIFVQAKRCGAWSDLFR